MGQQELEAALRREGESKAREIWQAAELAAAQLRNETDVALQQLEDSETDDLERAGDAVIAETLAATRRQSSLSRLQAEQCLAERLLALAKEQLPELAKRGGAELFHTLADEVPAADWRLVKVNERDEQTAKDRFPNAEVIVSEPICGGLVVEDVLATVIIINTLEKRLVHLWPELLPGLLQQLRPKGEGDEAVGGT